MLNQTKHLLEMMCCRKGKKGYDILLRREKKHQVYWHNFLTDEGDQPWTLEKATQLFHKKTQIHERVRYLTGLISDAGATQSLYMVYLTEDDYSLLTAYPEEIMWVNSDVLIGKLVQRPEKFKPELLEMVTLCLRELHQGQAIAV